MERMVITMKITYNDRILGIISEYEDIILGKRKTLSYWYFNNNKEHDEEIALAVFKYAFEKLLHWTPQMIYECNDMDIIVQMHLSHLYKYKIKPVHLETNDNLTFFQFIAKKLYPDVFGEDIRQETLNIYIAVLDGRSEKIPKNMFDGSNGLLKLAICLQYLLSEKLKYKTIEEMYSAFSMPDINNTLSEYKILIPFQRYFETPIDFLHFALPSKYKNRAYYLVFKRRYCNARVFSGSYKRYISEYYELIKGKREGDIFCDDLGSPYPDSVITCFTHFLHIFLPNDMLLEEYDPKYNVDRDLEFSNVGAYKNEHLEEIMEEYNNCRFKEAYELYDLMASERADFILDKYCLRDVFLALSDNYVSAFDGLLAENERDAFAYDYAFEKCKRRPPSNYKPISLLVRHYLALLDSDVPQERVRNVITTKKELFECLLCIKENYWPYDMQFGEYDSFEELLVNVDFLNKYKLAEVIRSLCFTPEENNNED